MHSSSTNIGAFIRTATPEGDLQGYAPAAAAAGTSFGPAFTYDGAKSCTLAASTGAADGGPTTQSCAISLQSALPTGSTWVDVPDSTVTLTEDSVAGEVDVNLTLLTSGHSRLRTKVVRAFTGGTAPEQAVAAVVALGGFSEFPV